MDKLNPKQKQNGSPSFHFYQTVIFLVHLLERHFSLTSFLPHSTGFLQVPDLLLAIPDRLLAVPDPAFCFPDHILHELDCHGPRQGPSRWTQPITVETSTIDSSRVKLRAFGVIFGVKHPYDS